MITAKYALVQTELNRDRIAFEAKAAIRKNPELQEIFEKIAYEVVAATDLGHNTLSITCHRYFQREIYQSVCDALRDLGYKVDMSLSCSWQNETLEISWR